MSLSALYNKIIIELLRKKWEIKSVIENKHVKKLF